jgi:hypothetical protein
VRGPCRRFIGDNRGRLRVAAAESRTRSHHGKEQLIVQGREWSMSFVNCEDQLHTD